MHNCLGNRIITTQLCNSYNISSKPSHTALTNAGHDVLYLSLLTESSQPCKTKAITKSVL